jgi:phosphoribosylformylglycinamidine synthase
LETWSNESQERYVIAIHPNDRTRFNAICARENAPYAIVGEIRNGSQFTVRDTIKNTDIIDIDLGAMLDHNVPLELQDTTYLINGGEITFENISLDESLKRVLRHPAVSDKSFLVTIGDRTV